MASPILAQSFENLPPTHIITAEFDICRDEALKYADLLANSGNMVSQKCYAGVPHAFGHYLHPQKGLGKSQQYLLDTCEVLKQAHCI